MTAITGLNIFTAGTPAKSSEVNNNFNIIKTFAEGLSTGANLDAGSVSATKIATNAITSDKIVNNSILMEDLAASLQKFLVPVGTISAYAGVTAPTGWLLCDGTSTATYTTLAALVGSTTPDMRGRFALGDDSSLTLLAAGGSTTISTANLPVHSHNNTATASTSVSIVGGGAHGHTAGSYDAGAHSHGAGSYAAGNHAHVMNATTDNTNPTTLANVPKHNLTADYMATGTAGGATVGGGVAGAVQAAGEHTHGIYVDGVANHSHGVYVNGVADHGHGASASTTVTMSNGSTGSGTAYYQPHVVINYIIKHD